MNSLREQSIPDIMIQRSIVFIAVLLAAQQSAMATTFDLHNLGAINAGFKSVTIGGITLTLESEGTGNLVSTSTRFGIDGSGASDATDLIDGGNGTAEQLAFLFSPAVVLDSIVISEFDGDDAGTTNLKGIGAFNLSSGANAFGALLGNGSANFITWTGPNATGGTRGFSVDAFNVHTVPEPASGLIAMLGVCCAGILYRCGATLTLRLRQSSPNWR